MSKLQLAKVTEKWFSIHAEKLSRAGQSMTVMLIIQNFLLPRSQTEYQTSFYHCINKSNTTHLANTLSFNNSSISSSSINAVY